jgi:hypothetical protein
MIERRIYMMGLEIQDTKHHSQGTCGPVGRRVNQGKLIEGRKN